MPLMMRIKLSAMMFLQFMMLPVWFIPMFPYVQSMEGGADWAMWCGMIMGFGTFTSPLFGMFADRYMNAEKVLALCNFACAALLGASFFATSPAVLFFILLAAMCFYMPTWSLTATIAMANSTTAAFPQIRVWGTIGWVASGIFSFLGIKVFGIANFDATAWIFVGGAIAAALGGLLAFALPATEPSAKGQPCSVADALGLKALVLFKNPMFCVFAVLIFLSMVPFQWYNVYNSLYLKESGFKYLTVTQNLGQVGEIGFMLLIPVILKKFGYKWAMVIGLGALTFRYACFGASVMGGVPAFDFGGLLIHGLIFGLLIVGSQMYVDDVAPKELRNQAQGLINLITGGVGVFASNALFDALLKQAEVKDAAGAVTHNWVTPYGVAFVAAAVLMVLMAVLFRPKATEK